MLQGKSRAVPKHSLYSVTFSRTWSIHLQLTFLGSADFTSKIQDQKDNLHAHMFLLPPSDFLILPFPPAFHPFPSLATLGLECLTPMWNSLHSFPMKKVLLLWFFYLRNWSAERLTAYCKPCFKSAAEQVFSKSASLAPAPSLPPLLSCMPSCSLTAYRPASLLCWSRALLKSVHMRAYPN